MNSRQALVAVAVTFILAMLALVPWLTGTLGATRGYIAVFLLYWLLFCLPMGWIFRPRGHSVRALGLAVGAERWVPWTVAAQVGAVAVSSWIMAPDRVPLLAILFAVPFGLVNGFCEEFFWRGAFLHQGRGNALFQALGVGLFTLWHVPLALAHGVTYPGGAVALVGGAMGLGAFWAFIAYRTDRIGWPIISHMLTNAVAFSGLISLNFL